MTKSMNRTANELLSLKQKEELLSLYEINVQKIGPNTICRTDRRAKHRSRTDLVIDATDGYIPLWDQNLVLNWRFNKVSLLPYANPEEIMVKVRYLWEKALTLWGWTPIGFKEREDLNDFEIVVNRFDDCTDLGCTLAQAFFPDQGRHPLYIYPKMFEQTEKEQVDTLAHEIGHIFGLRHFFAPEFETQFPSVIFGDHKPFTIMNYGGESEMSDSDRNDLKLLYESVWKGELTAINKTRIKKVRPFHYFNV